jgi:hypothetical protein
MVVKVDTKERGRLSPGEAQGSAAGRTRTGSPTSASTASLLPAATPPSTRPAALRRRGSWSSSAPTTSRSRRSWACLPTTIIHWRAKHPEFAEALRFRDENGTFADDRVKRSLLHKATGYSYHGEKIFYDKEAGVVRVPIVEHVPPSDTAMNSGKRFIQLFEGPLARVDVPREAGQRITS